MRSRNGLDELIDVTESGRALARDWQEFGWHLAAAPMVHLRRPVWEVLSRRLVGQLPRSVKVSYRQLSTAAMNMAAIPRAQDFMVNAIAQYISDPAVQVITYARRPARPAAHPPGGAAGAGDHREAAEQPQLHDRHLARHPEGYPPRLRPRRADRARHAGAQGLAARPAQASVDLAEPIAELPEGMRATLVQAAAKAGRRKLGYVVQYGEDLVASKAAQFSREVADAARACAAGPDVRRRPDAHPAEPRGAVPPRLRAPAPRRPGHLVLTVRVVGNRLAAGLAGSDHLPGVDARPAGDADPLPQERQPPAPDARLHRRQVRRRRDLRDPGSAATRATARPPTRRSATASARPGPFRGAGEDVRTGHVRLTRPARHCEGEGRAGLAEGGGRWWMEQGPAITS